jgi:beta-lactamase class A
MRQLRSREDFERALERIASNFSGEIGFAAKNLATGETIERKADAVMPTASVIKLAVLVELFRQAAEESLDLHQRLELREAAIVRGSGILKELGPGLNPTVYDLATLMVVLSDNTATNMLIDLVGGVDRVNRTMRQRLGLRTIVLHNRIDFEKIGNDVRRLAESSAREMAQLVEMLVNGEIVDAASSQAMVDIMQRQQYLDQVPRYVNFNPYAKELRIEQPVWVACKTGFFPGTRVDAGLMHLPDDITIAYCAMTDNCRDTSIAAESEGAVINGLMGRSILEYWWPGESAREVVLDSPYVAVVHG